MALWRAGQVRPRVINVDEHASYPPAIVELKKVANSAAGANVVHI
jgi:hypothetical protein